MSGWWNNLSVRERALVAVAGVLAAGLVLSLLVIGPLVNWNSAAERKASQARDTYELTAAAAAVSGSASSSAAVNATPLRQAVIATAGNIGIELVRIGSVTDATIEIQTAPTDADTLFGWFDELERRYGIFVTFADMTRGEAGRINAQVLVFERRS